MNGYLFSSIDEGINESTNRRSVRVVLFFALSMILIPGCKYPVSSPQYDQPSPYKVAPTITSITPPSEAGPGVNTITIHGHNLAIPSTDTLTPSSTVVYFNNSLVGSVVSVDSTSIVVRRPDVTGDSCTIEVEPHNGDGAAIFKPYKIDTVIIKYGSFLDPTIQLGAMAVDKSDNLYVVEFLTGAVHKVTTDGNNVVIGGGGSTTASPLAARIGPDGNLYVTKSKSRIIEKVDLASGAAASWAIFGDKPVTSGDFAPDGHFFVGGAKTDLRIVAPNPPAPAKSTDTLVAAKGQYRLSHYYATDTILVVHVFDGYVYVACNSLAKIWRNQIVGDSSLGDRELVVDMSSTAFASDPVTDFSVSSSGALYLSTSSSDVILFVDPSTGKVDNFYKGIVLPYCQGMAWSKTSNYLYLISGYTSTGTVVQPWTVYRLDMGSSAAPNF